MNMGRTRNKHCCIKPSLKVFLLIYLWSRDLLQNFGGYILTGPVSIILEKP